MTKLRLEVHRQGTRYVATAEAPNGRTISTHKFEHNPTGLTRLGPLWLLEQQSLPEDDQAKLRRFKSNATSKTQVAQYGYQLFRYLFGDGKAFAAYLNEETDAETLQLAINLDVDALPLWRLPWEYLHDGRHFLALSDRFSVSRCLCQCNTLTPPPADSPLHVLLAIPSPTDQPVPDYRNELTNLHEALSEPIEKGRVLLHVLFEATRHTLYDALQRHNYHVLHYLGQGTYDLEQRQGFLRIEGDTGRSEWISAREFTDLVKGQGLRLMVLQAYQEAPIGMIDAFNAVAAKALRREIPEILTVPLGLPQPSSRALQRELYSALGDGSSTTAAIQAIRQTLQALDREQNSEHRRFDWGAPILYSRADPCILVRPNAGKSAVDHPETQPPDPNPPQVNRIKEIRTMRTALQEGVRIFYLRGEAGIGKSRLISSLLRRPGLRIRDHLVIHCAELEDPLLAFDRIATFWQTHAADAHARAADHLLDSTKDPFERALQAQAYLRDARYAIVFEDIDVWFETPKAGDGQENTPKIARDLLRNLLLGLLSAEANTSYLFTGRRRWADLNTLPVQHRREIHLPLLQQHHAVQLMNTCPGLSNTSHEVKTSLYRLLGGHPETLLLASGWVKAGHNPNTLLENPPINERDTQNWAAYFARDLLHHLDPGERQILETAAVLTRPFTAQQLSALTSISDHYAAPILNKWTSLGMVEPILGRGEPRYRFHILTQNAVLDRLTPNDLRALHQRAATYYGGPFVDEARRQALIRSGTVWSDSRVAWLARDSNGILGLWLRRESDPELQRQILARALTWYHHLLKAGALKEASQIAQTLAPMLDQQGQRDLSRLLLQQSLIADDVVQRAENLGTLAKLRLQDGHLQSALEVYEEVVASLSGNMTQAQQAYILIRAGKIRQQMGEHGEAIDHYQRALNLMREEKNNEGEAQALHSLSTIYRETGNARQALVYSQAAMECYQSLDHQQGLTLVYYEQGLILKALSRYESALDRFTKSLEIARQLSDRLGIASTLMQIGEIFQRLDQDNRAIRALEESANHYARLQNPKEQEVLSRLEFIYAQQERFDQAVSQFREAKKRPRANGSGIGIETGDAPVDSEFNAG